MSTDEFQRLVSETKRRLTNALLDSARTSTVLATDYCALVWVAAACREGVKRLDHLSEEEVRALEEVYTVAGRSAGIDGSAFSEKIAATIHGLKDSPAPHPGNRLGAFDE